MVVAADTRLSTGFSILSRDQSKIVKLNDRVLLASCGFQADRMALWKYLQYRFTTYKYAVFSGILLPIARKWLKNFNSLNLLK